MKNHRSGWTRGPCSVARRRRFRGALFAAAISSFLFGASSVAQPVFQPMGLEGLDVTSFSANYGILAAGTERHGVYWQSEFDPPETGWTLAGLDTLSVKAVYAHKSGPIGWAISAGVIPDKTGNPFLYCSYLGGPFESRSGGIADSLTAGVVAIDGFPDPTICGETYAAGGHALYRRYFTDTTWTPVYYTTHEGDLAAVAAREEFPGVVLAGGSDGFAGFLLIRSTDFGNTWDDISPPTAVSDVDFGGVDGETIFVAGYRAVHRSTDGGTSWSKVWDGLGVHDVTEIAYDSGSGYVFAAGRATEPDTSGILMTSADGGDTWKKMPLPVGPIVDLELSGEYLFVATRNDGVFRLPTTSLGDDGEVPPGQEAPLGPNYPNPFAETTTIPFTILRAADVTLTVFDLLGREVEVLIARTMPAGDFEVTFDAHDIPAGMYFYRLEDGTDVATRVMIVGR